jgi:hypothetical protein
MCHKSNSSAVLLRILPHDASHLLYLFDLTQVEIGVVELNYEVHI